MIIVSLFALYKKTLSHVTEEWLTKITQLIKGSVGTQIRIFGVLFLKIS